MRKMLNYVFRGIAMGNILIVISYLMIYLITGNEGLKIALDNLSNEYNYIRMMIYSSLSGGLIYLLYGYCCEYIIKERKEQNLKKKIIKVGIFVVSIFIYSIIITFNVFRIIYNEEIYNQIYCVNSIIVIAYVFGISTFNIILKSEVNWININLKKRQQ